MYVTYQLACFIWTCENMYVWTCITSDIGEGCRKHVYSMYYRRGLQETCYSMFYSYIQCYTYVWTCITSIIGEGCRKHVYSMFYRRGLQETCLQYVLQERAAGNMCIVCFIVTYNVILLLTSSQFERFSTTVTNIFNEIQLTIYLQV